MAKNGGEIVYKIGFDIERKQLNELKKQLQEISAMNIPGNIAKMNPGMNADTTARSISKSMTHELAQINKAFNSSFNTATGITNIRKLNEEFKKIDLVKLTKDMSAFGQEGNKALTQIATRSMTTTLQFKETNNILQELGKTFMNTVRWKISSSVINSFTGSIQQAYGYIKHLDSSLNDIRIVTGKSADEMERFAKSANKAAKALGASTTEYTEASLIYYQQGLSDEEVQARAETTLKAANVTGQSGSAVSEELTAVWNGYKITAEETELAVDKLAAVAATTAADLEELSVGMSKVASAANNMGVDIDQLNAQIATIVSVTRQAPESVGTALKTIYARMADLKLGDTDEDGLKLGDVSSSLEKVGISVLDTSGDLRDMGAVIEEVAGKWNTWTKAQQAAIAQSLAGKRQYNNLVSLFDNWGMYEKALETSRNSMGTLQKQQDIYMQSTEAHLQVLQTQWEDLYDSLLDTTTLNKLIDALTEIVSLFTSLTDAVGGMKGVFLGLTTVVTKLFNKQFSTGLENIITKFRNAKENAANEKAQEEITKRWGETKGLGPKEIDDIVELKKNTQQYYDVMNDEEKQLHENLIARVGDLAVIKQEQEDIAKNFEERLKAKSIGQKGYGQGIEGSKKTENRDIIEGMNIDTNPSDINMHAVKDVLSSGIEIADNTEHALNRVHQQFREQIEDSQLTVESYEEMTSAEKRYEEALMKTIKANALNEDQQERLLKANRKVSEARKKLAVQEDRLRDIEDYQNTKQGQHDRNQKYLDEQNKLVFKYKEGKISDEDFTQKQRELQESNNKDLQILQQKEQQLAQKLKQDLATVTVDGISFNEAYIDSNGEIDLKYIDEMKEGIKASRDSYAARVSTALSNESTQFEEVINEVKEENKKLIKQGEEIPNALTEARQEYQDSINQANSQNKEFSLRQTLSTVIDVVNGLTSVAFAAQGAKQGIQSIASGDTLSGLISLSTTVLPNIISGLSELVMGTTPLEKIMGGIKLGVSAFSTAYEIISYNYNQELERMAEEAKEAANAQQEVIQKANEEKNAIDQLAISYQNIYDLKDKQGELTDEQKSSLASLIEQYGDEHLKLLLLIEDYEGLEKAIRDKQAAERGEYVQENQLGAQTEFESILAAGHESGFFERIGFSDSDAEDILKSLSNAIFPERTLDYASQREIMDYLLDPKNASESIKILKQMKMEYKDYSSSFDNMITDIQAASSTYNEDIVLEGVKWDTITNSDEFYQELERISSMVGKDGKMIGEEFAKQIMSGYSDQMAEFASEGEKKKEIFDVVAPTKENLDFYETLSEDDRIFLYSNKELAADSKNLKEFFNIYQTEYNRIQNEKNKRAVEDLFDHIKTSAKGDADFKLNTKEGKELVSSLYNAGGFEDFSGIAQEDFLKLDFSEQQQRLADYYHTLYQEEEDFRSFQQGNIKSNLELELSSIENKEIAYNTFVSDFKNQYKDQVEDIDSLLDNEALIENFDDLPDIVKKGIPPQVLETITAFKTGLKNSGFEIRTTGKQAEYFQNQIKSVNKMLENAEDAIYSFLPELESYRGVMHEINNNFDELQSTYQTLTDVIEDYNDDQKLTLDNLQKILEMDEVYLAALQFEDGQLKLNESSYESMIQIKIKEAQMTATQTFLTELLAIKNGEAGDSALVYAEKTYAEAEALGEMAAAAQEGINKLMQLSAVQDAMKVDATATGNAVKAYYARMQLIGNVASQSVSDVLGKSSKSSGSNKPDHEDYLERETDLYAEINQELDDIENKLKRIQETENHSWAQSRLDALVEENKLLDEQIDKLREKKKLQEQDLSVRRKQLEDLGASFSESGSILYGGQDIINSLYENYNKNYVDKYNAMTKSEQEAFKAEMETEKDRVEKIEKAVEDYVKLYSDYQSVIDEIQKVYYEQIEKNVEKFNLKVEVKLELDDVKREWSDFWHDVINDLDSDDYAGQINKILDNVSPLLGGNGDISEVTNHLNDVVSAVATQISSHGLQGLFGTDVALSKENLKEYMNTLKDKLKEVKEALDGVAENYLKQLEKANELINDQVEGWESVGDHIEHNIELIKMISGDDAYDELGKQFDQQYENDLKLLETQKMSKDYWSEQIKKYETLVDTTEEGSKEWKTYVEALTKSTEEYRQATADLDKTLQDTLKDIKDWYENSINKVTDALDKSLSGNLGLDLMEKEWKLIDDAASDYYDNVERWYNMEDYTKQLNDAANAIGLSAQNQAKLVEFRDKELEQLNAKEKLTQYDIEESKARLEILKAQLALEDLQQNKSKMRLRRDNQGNYTYQYTGDEAAIDQAENGLLTARRNWYEIVKKRYQETSNKIIEISKQQVELQKQIADAKAAGDTERENKLMEMYKRNQDRITFWYEQAGENQKDLKEGVAQYFAEVDNAEILPQSEATVRTLIDQWAGSGEDSFTGAVSKAIDDTAAVVEEFNKRNHVALVTAGVDYQNLVQNGIDPTTDALNDLVDSNDELGEKLEENNELLREQEEILRDLEDAYNQLESAASEALQSSIDMLEQLSRASMDAINDINAAVAAAPNAPTITGTSSYTPNDSGGGTPITTNDPLKNLLDSQARRETGITGSEVEVVFGSGLIRASSKNTNSAAVQKRLDTELKSTFGSNPGAHFSQGLSFSNGSWYVFNQVGANNLKDFLKKKNFAFANQGTTGFIKSLPIQFKTGGYTGEWGDTGRMAVLHQKELVLNESDTANMLKAVSLLREIPIDSFINSILGVTASISGLLSRVGTDLQQQASSVSAQTENNYRNMTVNADFSGVRSAEAIYQALTELENQYSQTAYSTSPIANRRY